MNREVEFRACEQETKEEKKASAGKMDMLRLAAGASATIEKKQRSCTLTQISRNNCWSHRVLQQDESRKRGWLGVPK